MTKDEAAKIKRAIILIHNMNHASVPHSRDYWDGLNILTKMVDWGRITPNTFDYPDKFLADIDCGSGFHK